MEKPLHLGRQVWPEEVKAVLIDGMATALGAEFQPGELTSDEWALAHETTSNSRFNRDSLALEKSLKVKLSWKVKP